MKIKIDEDKIVFLVTLILKVHGDEHTFGLKKEKREVYQTIMKQAKNEQEAVNFAEAEAKTKFNILYVEGKAATLLTPKIFLD